MKIYDEPCLCLYENFLTKEECDETLSDLHENESKFADSLVTKLGIKSKNRTSKTVVDIHNKYVWLKEKILSEIVANHSTELQLSHMDPLQSQRYGESEYYHNHVDFFNNPGDDKEVENDRVATVLIYLNDDFIGGETTFPYLDISIKPKAGCAVFFQYNYKNPLTNRKTLHRGNDVRKGTKFVITSWIRESPIDENNTK